MFVRARLGELRHAVAVDPPGEDLVRWELSEEEGKKRRQGRVHVYVNVHCGQEVTDECNTGLFSAHPHITGGLGQKY